MKWYRSVYENAKTHFFPEAIKDAVLKNLEERGCKYHEQIALHEGGAVKEVDSIGVSMGAPCTGDTSWMDHDLDGVKFGTETREMEFFLHELEELQERNDIGVPYYKLHGRLFCVCLLPEQRENVIRMMREKLPEAMAITDAENDAFNRKMAEMRQHANIAIQDRPVRRIEEG